MQCDYFFQLTVNSTKEKRILQIRLVVCLNYLLLFRVGGHLKPSLSGTSGALCAAIGAKLTLAVEGRLPRCFGIFPHVLDI